MDKKEKCGNCIGKKKAFIFEKTGEKNYCIAVLILILVMFMCTCGISMLFHNAVLDLLCIMFLTAEFIYILRLYYSFSETRKYRFRIKAVKKIKDRFWQYYVFSDSFKAFRDGKFSCGINESIPYYSEDNEGLENWILRNSCGQFDFYLEVYDRIEKRILSQDEIINNYLDKKDE